jgi:hypothetical protein
VTEFDDRLAELRRLSQAAVDREKQRTEAELAQRRSDWAKIDKAAQWALKQYQSVGISPSPILWEWSEIKPGPQRRVRELGHTKPKISMTVPEYVRRRVEIAKGYPIWTYHVEISEFVGGLSEETRITHDRYVLMVLASGAVVWCEDSKLIGGMIGAEKIPKHNGPMTPQILSAYEVTEWSGGQPDAVIDKILLTVAERIERWTRTNTDIRVRSSAAGSPPAEQLGKG